MYDELAPCYDLFVDWKARLSFEMPFIERQLSFLKEKNANIRILDTACGTGQHAIALAQSGYVVSGADLYPQMISIAKANAAAALVKVQFKSAAFGSMSQAFNSEGLFDAVLCLGNSLPHVESEDDLLITLQDFAALLNPDGLLLLQMRNFDQVLAKRNRFMEPQSIIENNKEWLFIRFYDFEVNGMIRFNMLSLKCDENQAWTMKQSSTMLMPILSKQILKVLNIAGFSEIQIFGDMTGSEFNSISSNDLVVVARKN